MLISLIGLNMMRTLTQSWKVDDANVTAPTTRPLVLGIRVASCRVIPFYCFLADVFIGSSPLVSAERRTARAETVEGPSLDLRGREEEHQQVGPTPPSR